MRLLPPGRSACFLPPDGQKRADVVAVHIVPRLASSLRNRTSTGAPHAPSAVRSLNLRPLRGTAESQLIEPPDADPPDRWCGRGEVVRRPPIPILPVYPPFSVLPLCARAELAHPTGMVAVATARFETQGDSRWDLYARRVVTFGPTSWEGDANAPTPIGASEYSITSRMCDSLAPSLVT
jgi:hypothetical protein